MWDPYADGVVEPTIDEYEAGVIRAQRAKPPRSLPCTGCGVQTVPLRVIGGVISSECREPRCWRHLFVWQGGSVCAWRMVARKGGVNRWA